MFCVCVFAWVSARVYGIDGFKWTQYLIGVSISILANFSIKFVHMRASLTAYLIKLVFFPIHSLFATSKCGLVHNSIASNKNRYKYSVLFHANAFYSIWKLTASPYNVVVGQRQKCCCMLPYSTNQRQRQLIWLPVEELVFSELYVQILPYTRYSG